MLFNDLSRARLREAEREKPVDLAPVQIESEPVEPEQALAETGVDELRTEYDRRRAELDADLQAFHEEKRRLKGKAIPIGVAEARRKRGEELRARATELDALKALLPPAISHGSSPKKLLLAYKRSQREERERELKRYGITDGA